MRNYLLLMVLVLNATSLLSPVRASNTGPIASAPLASESDRAHAGIQILDSDERHVVLELVAPPYELKTDNADGVACQVLNVEGYTAGETSGHPDLPVTGVMLGIPAGAQPTLKLLETETISVPGRFDLCPASRPVIQKDAAGRPNSQDELRSRDVQVYASDQFLPVEPAKIVSTGFIRSQRILQLRFQPYQYNPLTRELRYAPRLRVEVSFFPSGARVPASLGSFTPEGAFEGVLRNSLLNYDQARGWRTSPERSAAFSPLLPPQPQPYFKVLVDKDGLYALTYTDLLNAGVPVTSLDPRKLRLFNQDSEVALSVEGEQDGSFGPQDVLLFYGQKATTKFTNTNVYWLGWGANDGLRMGQPDAAPVGGATVPLSFKTTQKVEADVNYLTDEFSGPDKDHWFWDTVYATAGPATKDFTFQLSHVATGGMNATLRGLLKGYFASPYHHTRISINGHLIDDSASWPSLSEYTFDVSLPQSYLLEGANTIRVECPLDGLITQDVVLVNRFELDYYKTYTAENNQLVFGGDQAGTWEYRVDGFTTSNIDLFDISAPLTPQRIHGAVVQPTANGYQASFQQQISTARHYLALEPSRRLSPSSIFQDTPSDLKSAANAADYLIITHASFLSAVQPLANWRASRGLRVRVVDVQDVYDEFNNGVFNPQAIRDFLAYVYTSWSRPAPVYVLLVGDGNFDFKNNLGWGEPNYIPPYLDDIDPWIGETATDNRYVSVSGADVLPDMSIGRFPVKTEVEAQAMVQNVLDYEQDLPQDGWNGRVAFVADNADSAGDFAAISDAIASQEIPFPYTVDKIYYGVNYPTPAGANAAILQAINQGRLLINYTGHASTQLWASENLFRTADLPSLTNTGKLPLMVPMTCAEGYFIWPKPAGADYSSLAESVVRLAGRGAIASFSPTGFGLTTGHDLLDRGLLQAIFANHQQQVGIATTQAKIYLAAHSSNNQYLVETYMLFGDPAVRLQTLPPTAVFLTSYSAEPGLDDIHVDWQTAYEVELSGFNVYRADTPDGPRTQLNHSLILPKTPGSLNGNPYQYRDAAVEPGKTYYYWIEAVLFAGPQVYGPVSAIAPYWSRLWLPVIQ